MQLQNRGKAKAGFFIYSESEKKNAVSLCDCVLLLLVFVVS
jgi:hypothetical protein